MRSRLSVRDKILVPIALLVLTVSALTIGLLVAHMNQLLRENAVELAAALAGGHGNEIRVEIDGALGTARTLAQAFGGRLAAGSIPAPEEVHATLRGVLSEHPEFVGIWSRWEPGFPPGLEPGSPETDDQGRFLPFWHRFGGEVVRGAPDAAGGPELALAYARVLRTGRETVTDPAARTVGDQSVIYATLMAPIRVGERFVGAVGVAVPLRAFWRILERIRPFETGYGFFLSNSGLLMGHPLRETLGTSVARYVPDPHKDALLRAIREGRSYVLYKQSIAGERTESLFAFVPFPIGDTGSPWSFAVSIPEHRVLENSRTLLIYSVLTGLLAILVLILMIFSISRRIVRPLYTLVDVSKSLAEGNFERRAHLPNKDEFGRAGKYIDAAFDIVVDKMVWYENMLDAIPFPVSVTDLEGRWTFLNAAAEKMLDLRRSAAAGRPCEEWDAAVCDLDACGVELLRRGVPTSRHSPAGRDRTFQIDAAWLRNRSGEKVGHIEIAQDITESTRLQRQADERDWLRYGETELNHAARGELSLDALGRRVIGFLCKYLKAYSGAFYVADPEDHRLRLTATFAHHRRKDLAAVFAPGEGIVGQAAREKSPIHLAELPPDYIRVESGLGSAVPSYLAVLPFLFEDRVRGVVELATFHDLTELEMEFLRTVLPHIGIVVNTAESRAEMARLLDKTQAQAEELKARQEELRRANAELESQTRALRESQASLQAGQEELRVTNEELEQRTRDLEAQRDDIRKKNHDLEMARQEIAQKARDLERASRYKSEFLANMSHELRTPLNSILILSQLLTENRDGNLSDRQVEFAGTIHASGADLLGLINEILDLSKVEAGRLDLDVAPADPAELAEEARRTFGPEGEKKGVPLEIHLEPGLPGTITTDRRRVWQILKNLLANAFKFTDSGHVALRIFRPAKETDLPAPDLKPDRAVAFAVSDTGIGIPEDKQELIFEAFQQADGTTSRKYGGTGLGLSISREFARFLGGGIALESAPGEGSTFTLYLPEDLTEATPRESEFLPPPPPVRKPRRVAESPPDAPAGGKGRPGAEPGNRGKRTAETKNSEATAPAEAQTDAEEENAPDYVPDDRRRLGETDNVLLIVEDDPNFSRVLADIARERGFKVLVAEDGETGLHFADYYRPSGVILDLGLPGIDGWTVMDRLKSSPATRHIPIHVVSAADQPDQPMDALRMGAVGFLTKPVTVDALEDAFRRIENVTTRPVKRLLVVEDDPVQVESILTLVADGDVEAESAETAEDAFEKLSQAAFDCVILDLGLAGASGFELLERIRATRGISRTPVIIYTGRDLTRDEEARLQRYADSVIIKGARSPERLLEETTLFLHRVASEMPSEKREILESVDDRERAFQGKTILIVDDDMRNVFALASVLESVGLSLVEARDGREGLARLEDHPEIDLVLMDIMMPEMDGYAAMRAIREQDRHRNLPIIALTAKAMKGDKAKCIEAGANDYLAKPVDTDKLLSMLRVWLF
ncbi:MAG: response regulator [Desulfococcaceae bacterium]